MDFDSIRRYCLSFPGAAEQVQWENHMLFKVGGKMFLIYNLDKTYPNRFSIKCTPENFAVLTEQENIIPAPYLARNNWVNFKDGFRMKAGELKGLIDESYQLVFQKLPKKEQKKITEADS
jgi:predicted DNA-binding protein (MmcQ/YjbR family)